MPQLDADALRILALRNGLGAAKKPLSPEDQQLLAKMQTNQQGRAVLGVVAQYLQRAYALVDSASSVMPGTGSLKSAMRSRLDNTNRYAQKTYAGLPDDATPLSPQNRRRIEEAVREARAALSEFPADVEDINRGFTGALVDTLTSVLPPWLRPSGGKHDKLIIALGVGAGVLALLLAIRLVKTVALGESEADELAEAENEAIRIADALRRKKASRSAFSLS